MVIALVPVVGMSFSITRMGALQDAALKYADEKYGGDFVAEGGLWDNPMYFTKYDSSIPLVRKRLYDCEVYLKYQNDKYVGIDYDTCGATEMRLKQSALVKEEIVNKIFEKDGLLKQLTKCLLEKALDAEMDSHLGYSKHQRNSSSNARNSYSNKSLSTDTGSIDISVPRNRVSHFEHQISA